MHACHKNMRLYMHLLSPHNDSSTVIGLHHFHRKLSAASSAGRYLYLMIANVHISNVHILVHSSQKTQYAQSSIELGWANGWQ